MKRRDFMQLLGATGMSMVCPLASRSAFAADPNDLVVTVMASGGWDTTMFCDPKGDKNISGKGVINPFSKNDIKSAASGSPIRYAPIVSGQTDTGSFDTLFNSHHKKMLVINGVNVFGGHGTGLQHASAGSKAYPTIGAMVAASHGNNLSNGFISFGGSGGGDNPYGEAAITRISDIKSIGMLAETNSYQSDAVYNLIDDAKRKTAKRLQTELALPSRQRASGQLFNAMNSTASISSLMTYIPGSLSEGMVGQAELVSAAFASGMSVAGNLKISPFDSHSGNDRTQSQYLQEVAAAVNKLWEMAEQYGYDDKLTVILLSEGGRGPFYNSDQGKDDISENSMMVMSNKLSGNRVIQATNDAFEIQAVNVRTHQTDEGGEIIEPMHIHQELRNLLNINKLLVDKYPLGGTNMNLFGV